MKTKSLFAKRLVALAMAAGFLAMFVPQANAVQPCCDITNIDTRTGVVTAQDTNTGHTFQFVASPAVLQKIKVGQGVYANFKTHQVSLNNAEPCCNITKSGGSAATRGVPNPNNVEPCCQITQIDKRTGMITAIDKTTGHSFQFTAGPSVQQSLKVGQPVYANFKTSQVSLDGNNACCNLVSVGSGRQIAPVDNNKLGTQIAREDGVTTGSPTPKTRSAQGSAGRLPVAMNTRSVDPCAMFTAAQLQQYIAAQINSAFPIVYSAGGESLAIKNPDLRSVTCAPLQIQARTDLQYKKTRGFPQFSTSGDASFQTGMVGRVASTAASNAPITASDFQSASLCLIDVNVTSLNLKNVPNWLDNAWLRDYLNQQLVVGNRCQDISALVSFYLSNGGAIPPASPAGIPAATGLGAKLSSKGSIPNSPVH